MMPLSAIFKKTYSTSHWGTQPPFTSTSPTKNVSPAQGIVPTANSGDSQAGAYVTASVLGTGVNTDTVTNGVEAV